MGLNPQVQVAGIEGRLPSSFNMATEDVGKNVKPVVSGGGGGKGKILFGEEADELRKKLTLFTHKVHIPGPDYLKGKGIQPNDYAEAFKGAIKFGEDTWYALSTDGKGIYKYVESLGKVHWNGSSLDLVNPLKGQGLPPEIIKHFNFNVKGANTPWR